MCLVKVIIYYPDKPKKEELTHAHETQETPWRTQTASTVLIIILNKYHKGIIREL